MKKNRTDFLIEVAFQVADLRDMKLIVPLLVARGIIRDDEITMCLATAVIINGKRLDSIAELFEPIEEASSSQEDEILLN